MPTSVMRSQYIRFAVTRTSHACGTPTAWTTARRAVEFVHSFPQFLEGTDRLRTRCAFLQLAAPAMLIGSLLDRNAANRVLPPKQGRPLQFQFRGC